MKELLKEYKGIAKDFFDVDDENKIAHLKLEYQKPSDIFTPNIGFKIPLYTEDFFDWIENFILYYAPSNYKIHLDVTFDDLEGYTEEELEDIFRKNILLESRRSRNISHINNYGAIGLLILGLIMLFSMVFVFHYWKDDNSLIREMLRYVVDVATMLIIWESITIIVVDNNKRRNFKRNFAIKYEKVRFHLKEKK